eukprot:365617-Chlamydomonas_euryale.AAC.22
MCGATAARDPLKNCTAHLRHIAGTLAEFLVHAHDPRHQHRLYPLTTVRPSYLRHVPRRRRRAAFAPCSLAARGACRYNTGPGTAAGVGAASALRRRRSDDVHFVLARVQQVGHDRVHTVACKRAGRLVQQQRLVRLQLEAHGGAAGRPLAHQRAEQLGNAREAKLWDARVALQLVLAELRPWHVEV